MTAFVDRTGVMARAQDMDLLICGSCDGGVALGLIPVCLHCGGLVRTVALSYPSAEEGSMDEELEDGHTFGWRAYRTQIENAIYRVNRKISLQNEEEDWVIERTGEGHRSAFQEAVRLSQSSHRGDIEESNDIVEQLADAAAARDPFGYDKPRTISREEQVAQIEAARLASFGPISQEDTDAGHAAHAEWVESGRPFLGGENADGSLTIRPSPVRSWTDQEPDDDPTLPYRKAFTTAAQFVGNGVPDGESIRADVIKIAGGSERAIELFDDLVDIYKKWSAGDEVAQTARMMAGMMAMNELAELAVEHAGQNTPDDLDETIAERTELNPEFPQMVEAAEREAATPSVDEGDKSEVSDFGIPGSAETAARLDRAAAGDVAERAALLREIGDEWAAELDEAIRHHAENTGVEPFDSWAWAGTSRIHHLLTHPGTTPPPLVDEGDKSEVSGAQ